MEKINGAIIGSVWRGRARCFAKNSPKSWYTGGTEVRSGGSGAEHEIVSPRARADLR